MSKDLKQHRLSTFLDGLKFSWHLNEIVDVDVNFVDSQFFVAVDGYEVLDVAQEVVNCVNVPVGDKAKIYLIADSVEQKRISYTNSRKHIPSHYRVLFEGCKEALLYVI